MDKDQQDRLIARLHVLAKAVADRNFDEFTLRVPVEIERDADLVLSRAAEELERLRARVAELEGLGGVAVVARDSIKELDETVAALRQSLSFEQSNLAACSEENGRLRKRVAELEAAQNTDLDVAIDMLAEWCVSVSDNGTGWDDWDECYKDAAYRPGPLRGRIDLAMDKIRALKAPR